MPAAPTLSSPFLTAEQSAVELGTTPLNVRRLAARGVLKAAWVGGDALRVLPADLASYASSGCPDFVTPRVDSLGYEFVTEGAYALAERLDRDIREALDKIANETTEIPGAAEIVVPIAGELATVVNGTPYQPLARMKGVDYTPPFRTRAEGFAVNFLRQKVAELLRQSGSRLSGTSIDRFYRTQSSYRDAVNAAWTSWGQRSFSVRKTFPAPKPLAQPVTVTFRVPYSALAVDQQRVTQLAF